MIRLAVLFGLGLAAFVASAVVANVALARLRELHARRLIREEVPSEETGTDGWRVASFLWQVRVPLNCKAARRLVDLFRGLQVLAGGLMVWGLLSVG